MSRSRFRLKVTAPRPASAWALVTVASATLWITRQLEVWAMALQASAILVSLWRREAPFGWQRSALALNLGMVAIVACSTAVAVRGEPSTIALAHFAALTQGLQLLDARPRATEYLLVTLALFQVILASNLTDSVFFPPLLAAFLLAAVWTLMVHTLRSEALEAGDPGAVSRAITPGLVRTTLLASGLSVVLALALFVTLPRLRSNVVSGVGLAPALASAGFSSHVALGDLGRIRQDPRVVMRVQTLEGDGAAPEARYWRGLAFDRFDGTSWSITPPGRHPIPGSAEGGVSFGRRPHVANLVQRIVREPVEAGVLFGIGDLRRLQGTVRRLERDASGGLYAVGQADERVRYRVASYRHRWREDDLQRDPAAPGSRADARYLQLPKLSEATADLAREIVQGSASDAERVRALESFLLANGRYTNVPPRVDTGAGSPLETFLHGGMAGHCEYFASAMVVMARSLGIPARLVNGFAGGRANRIGNFLEVTRSDAHSWVEVHYERAGWVRYDPTPPDLRARPAAALSLSERARELASALELWWFQRVVGFDRADQIHALKRAWLAWRGAREATRERRRPGDAPAAAWSPTLPGRDALLAAVAATLACVLLRRRRRRSRESLPASYAEALRLLSRRGLTPHATATARDFAARVAAAHGADVARCFSVLTESYLAARFGGRPERSGSNELRALRAALARRS
jgi:transglutaminase-like putative cysteine protease